MACSGRTSSAILLSSRDQISLHYTKLPGPTWLQPSHTPLHSQRKSFNNGTILISFTIDLTLHLSSRMLPLYHWNVHSFGLTNPEPAIYFHSVWTKRTWSHDFGAIGLECMNVLFIWILFIEATNTQHVCSDRPFHLALGTLVIHGDMTRHGQKLTTHTSTTSRARGSIHLAKLDIQNNLLSILCSILESGPSGEFCSICKTVPQVLQTFFSWISRRKNLLRCPKLETGFLALPLRPGP